VHEPDGVVLRPHGQDVAAGRKGEGGDRLWIRRQLAPLLAGGRVHKSERDVPLSCGYGQGFAVRGESEVADGVGVLEPAQLLARGRLTETDLVAHTERQDLPLGGEGTAPIGAHDALEPAYLLPGGRFPVPQAVVPADSDEGLAVG